MFVLVEGGLVLYNVVAVVVVVVVVNVCCLLFVVDSCRCFLLQDMLSNLLPQCKGLSLFSSVTRQKCCSKSILTK